MQHKGTKKRKAIEYREIKRRYGWESLSRWMYRIYNDTNLLTSTFSQSMQTSKADVSWIVDLVENGLVWTWNERSRAMGASRTISDD